MSYNFTDIAEGTGIIKLYFQVLNDSSGLSYILNQNKGYSGRQPSTGDKKTIDSLTTGGTTDLDFDLTQFKRPITIEGIAHVTVGFKFLFVGSGQTTLTVKVRKWDGSTETEIVSVSSAGLGNGSDIVTIESMRLTIPKTKFKRGETLRVTLQVSRTGTARGAIGHDPQNRDGEWLSPSGTDTITASFIDMPFDLDL